MPPIEDNNAVPTMEEVFRSENLFDGLSADGQTEPGAEHGQATDQTAGNAPESASQGNTSETNAAMAQTGNVPPQAQTTAQNVPNTAMGTAQPDASAILNLLIPAFRAMQSENQQLKQSMTQQSDNTKAQLEEALEPPTLDINGMMYDDDETRAKKQNEYNAAMLEYQRKMLMKDMQPMVDSYRAQQQSQAVQAAINGLRNTPGVGDKFADVAADIPQTIQSIPALRSLPPQEAVSIAALVAKGRAATNAQAKTPEQVADEVFGNPEVMKLLELKRTQQYQQNRNIPPMSASQGAMASAPINVEAKPETVQEAFDQFSKMLLGR